uniref:Uncharacterized protein n=1 Tax=Pararge aegeria TaxID=116150 RepID=S4P0D3_9NEOP
MIQNTLSIVDQSYHHFHCRSLNDPETFRIILSLEFVGIRVKHVKYVTSLHAINIDRLITMLFPETLVSCDNVALQMEIKLKRSVQ